MMAERNYSTIEHEALTTVNVIKEFYILPIHMYLYGFIFKLHFPTSS